MRELPEAMTGAIAIVGEHLARGGLDGAQLGALLDVAGRVGPPPRLAGSGRDFHGSGPTIARSSCPRRRTTAIARLLTDIPFESRSDMLRLARLWNAGNTARAAESSTAMRCRR